MPNINVLKRLEKIENELEQIVEFITQYHGIPKKEAESLRRVSDRITSMTQAMSHDCTLVIHGEKPRY